MKCGNNAEYHERRHLDTLALSISHSDAFRNQTAWITRRSNTKSSDG